jgi:hypothetical protein
MALLFIVSPVLGKSGSFPKHIYFRDKDVTFNSKYNFLLKDNKIWISRRDPLKNNVIGKWEVLPFHKKLKNPTEISADSGHFIAIGKKGRIFSTRGALGDNIKKIKGTTKWGAPLWLGKGQHLPAGTHKWSISFLSPKEDKYWIDPGGNKQSIGQGVSTLFVLDKGRQTITYLDPWLPVDLSYKVCSPIHGRFQSENISVSGSTLFVINRFGDMYTQTYDFDISGADPVFFNYTYNPKKGFGTRRDPNMVMGFFTRRVIPIQGWTKQPKIKGTITDRITIVKKGVGAFNRIMRVEGVKDGKTGYFQRETAGKKEWTFFVTEEPLKGTFIKNKVGDFSMKTLGVDMSMGYIASEKKYSITISNFNRYCTPSTFMVNFKNGKTLNLKFHHHDVIRSSQSVAGLSEKWTKLGGAIEVPPELKNLSKQEKKFIKEKLKNKRFTNVSFKANLYELKMKKILRFNWSFKRMKD